MTTQEKRSSKMARSQSPPAQRPWSWWLDSNPFARSVGGNVARYAGLAPGFARGAWHTAEGAAEGLNFVGRLLDPYDAVSSPRGEAAWDTVANVAQRGSQYIQNAVKNPRMVVNDANRAAEGALVRLDPRATVPASTFGGELRRNFDIGMNQGEAVFDVGSLVYGGAELKGLAELGAFRKGGQAATYLARGYPPGLSEYFATPYDGWGHHLVPRRTKLPKFLGGGPVPKAISDSRINVLKPPGVDTGAFYERHFKVDRRFGGGRIPAENGGGRWSGEELGWTKYGPLGRVFYGAPAPLKAAAGGGLVGTGALIDWILGLERANENQAVGEVRVEPSDR